MIEFTIETSVDRPVGEVFAFATDPARLGEWQTNTVSARPEDAGPLRLGSRIREVHRAPGGREMHSLVEVSEYEPDRVFALRVIEGVPVHARMTFEGDGSGTVVGFRGHGRLTGPMRLLEPIVGRSLRRQFATACGRLKDELESPDPPRGAQ